MITYLEAEGLVQRRVDSTNRRQSKISLTAKGRSLVTQTQHYGPASPTPSTGGPSLGDELAVDDAGHENRDDVITFTTAPLRVGMDVTGTPGRDHPAAIRPPSQDISGGRGGGPGRGLRNHPCWTSTGGARSGWRTE